MNQILIAILGIVGSLLTGVVMFVLGQRRERNRQSLLIRAQMLDPINDWLKGVGKFTGILGDTLTSVSIMSPGPITYDLEERRQSAQFMIENTNEVLGIIEAKSLITNRTRKEAIELAKLIRELEQQVKFKLLPLDHEILNRSAKGNLNESFVIQVGETKLEMEKKIQDAYALLSKIKTLLT